MSHIARYVIKGPAAYLIVRHAKRVADCCGKAIYQLETEPFQLAVYDSRGETLVVFDGPGLVSVAAVEVSNARTVESAGGIDVVA